MLFFNSHGETLHGDSVQALAALRDTWVAFTNRGGVQVRPAQGDRAPDVPPPLVAPDPPPVALVRETSPSQHVEEEEEGLRPCPPARTGFNRKKIGKKLVLASPRK